MPVAFAHWLRCLLPLLLLWPILAGAEGQLPTTELAIGGVHLTVEIADDESSRRRGLMYRHSLPADRGMLFVWSRPGQRRMWMKNTFIPLDVAFIDDNHVITNIETMQPRSENRYAAERAVRYALEVNAGWFARHGIEPGTRIPSLGKILETVK